MIEGKKKKKKDEIKILKKQRMILLIVEFVFISIDTTDILKWNYPNWSGFYV